MPLENIELENLKKSFIQLSPELKAEFVCFLEEDFAQDNSYSEHLIRKELDRRWLDYESGKISAEPFEIVMERLKKENKFSG